MTIDLRDQLLEFCAVIDDEQGPITVDDVQTRNDAVISDDRPTRPVVSVRRGWLVASAAAALVVVASLPLLLFSDSNQPEVATATGEPVPITDSWFRVPSNESVFGGPGSQDMLSVTVGGPGMVAVGEDDGDVGVWTSTDGVSWSRIPYEEDVFGGTGPSRVTVGGPGLVAVGADDGRMAVWTSVDGVKWSRVAHDEAVFGDASVFSVTEGGPGLVAVGSTEPGDNRSMPFNVDAVVWTSVDGFTWSRVPHDETVFGGEENQQINDVTVGGPGLVAVGYDGCCTWDNPVGVAAVWTSVDGIVWSRVPHDDSVFGPSNEAMVSVTAGGPGLVAVGYSFGCRPVWTSVDGITWSRVTDDVPGACNRVMRDVIARGRSSSSRTWCCLLDFSRWDHLGSGPRRPGKPRERRPADVQRDRNKLRSGRCRSSWVGHQRLERRCGGMAMERLTRRTSILTLLVVVLAACNGSNSEPTATYTGGGCTYDGPAEFDINSEVTFTFVDETESESVGFAVWPVPEGTTAEQIHDEGIFNVGVDTIAWSSETQVSDYEWMFTATFGEAGLHALNCYDTSSGGEGTDYPNLITVSS